MGSDGSNDSVHPPSIGASFGKCRLMSYYVSIEHRVESSHVEGHLSSVLRDLAASPGVYPGRLHTRIFRSLADPGYLLAIGQWSAEADFARFLGHPQVRAHVVNAEPRPRISRLILLQAYTNFSRRPSVVHLRHDRGRGRRRTRWSGSYWRRPSPAWTDWRGSSPEELYRIEGDPPRFVQVHVWATFDDMDRFRTGNGRAMVADLGTLGATLERFDGVLAAEYCGHRADGPT